MHKIPVDTDAEDIETVFPPRDHGGIRAEGDVRAFGIECLEHGLPLRTVVILVVKFPFDFDDDIDPVGGPGSRGHALDARHVAEILPGGPLVSVPVFVVQGIVLADAVDVQTVLAPGRDGQRDVFSERMFGEGEYLPAVPLMAVPVQVRHFGVFCHGEDIQPVFPPADDAGWASQGSLERLQRKVGWPPLLAVVVLVQ